MATSTSPRSALDENENGCWVSENAERPIANHANCPGWKVKSAPAGGVSATAVVSPGSAVTLLTVQERARHGFTSLTQHAHVQDLIRREIDKANQSLARAEQIKAFRVLPKALDPEEEGEPVTPTRKVKRNAMYERFKPLIEEMYDDKEERLLAESAADALA